METTNEQRNADVLESAKILIEAIESNLDLSFRKRSTLINKLVQHHEKR